MSSLRQVIHQHHPTTFITFKRLHSGHHKYGLPLYGYASWEVSKIQKKGFVFILENPPNKYRLWFNKMISLTWSILSPIFVGESGEVLDFECLVNLFFSNILSTLYKTKRIQFIYVFLHAWNFYLKQVFQNTVYLFVYKYEFYEIS